MINLMPPTHKEQVRYAKMNQLALRYLQTTVLVVAVLGGVFAWSLVNLRQTAAQADKDVSEKQAAIASLKHSFAPMATDASNRLAAIAFVEASQTRFSALINDIALVVPQGVSIDSMTLTGDSKVPVRIGVTTTTYQAALAFRNALITSPRVAAADLESINANSIGGFQAAVVVGFKPGQAK
jgi:Tfp pilus assembly protein PilN